ncbi:helix-turn-helix transcriptional regulator [Paenibacillus sp. IB182363]|uniref:Helix-turn-helix transcriptional regulator n=1 Tax=Paenibacillus oceani TaxID=2772510 RepID=A0A927CBR6_9BACL|nr:helix-turn-helix transcriptional regulator [Paenibacillus oceani]
MLIFEHCPFLIDAPVKLDMFFDNSRYFKQLFHFHPGIEMIFVHEGSGQLILEQSIFEVKPGTLIFLKPYQPHYLQMQIGPGKPYIRSLMKYEHNYLSENLKAFPQLREFHDYICSDTSTSQVQYVPDWKNFEQFLRENYERLQRYPFYNQMEGNALFLVNVFHYLYPLWKTGMVSKQKKQAAEPTVAKMIRWINENYEQEFQLEALAQAVHISPNYASYIFRQTTGKTIMEFLTDRRIKQACILLKTTAASVQEIGEKSGWVNFNYFCSIFKKRLGMTPKQYRHH